RPRAGRRAGRAATHRRPSLRTLRPVPPKRLSPARPLPRREARWNSGNAWAASATDSKDVWVTAHISTPEGTCAAGTDGNKIFPVVQVVDAERRAPMIVDFV